MIMTQEELPLDHQPIGIPAAQEKLRKWAVEWGKPELAVLADQMYRRKPKYPRAKPQRRSLTPGKAKRIREYKEANPTMSNRDIGREFGVDAGRVSEAIHRVKDREKGKPEWLK
jgi:hypothetical protein